MFSDFNFLLKLIYFCVPLLKPAAHMGLLGRAVWGTPGGLLGLNQDQLSLSLYFYYCFFYYSFLHSLILSLIVAIVLIFIILFIQS